MVKTRGGVWHISGCFQFLLKPPVIGISGDGRKRKKAFLPLGSGSDGDLGRWGRATPKKGFFQRNDTSIHFDRNCPLLSALLPECIKAKEST